MDGKFATTIRAGGGVVAALSCLALAGCAAGELRCRPVRGIKQLKPGVSLTRVREILKQRGTHQFQVQSEGNEYLCLSFRFFNSAKSYYLVFSGGQLYKIVAPTGFEFREFNYRGSSVSVRMRFDPFDKVKAVLSRRGVTIEDIITAERRALAKETGIDQAPLTALALLQLPRLVVDYQRNEQLARCYDPVKLKVGMTPDEVSAAFGHQPRAVHALGDDREMWVYGEEASLAVNPRLRFSWVAVVFEKSSAIGIFSHDFFHPSFLRAPPPAEPRSLPRERNRDGEGLQATSPR